MLNLLFPRICVVCNGLLMSGEEILCAHCRHTLPLACFHRTEDETMKNFFYGKIAVQNASALLKFQKKGATQILLHQLKYRGQQEISTFFGKWMGAELEESLEYNNIDMVIPVPLHKQKLKKRGYNQVAGFGQEISKALQIPYRDDILIKVSKSGSQVFKTRILRFEAEEIFTIQHLDEIENKHILLVDDIITTGATLEKCALQLIKGKNVRISMATIAIA